MTLLKDIHTVILTQENQRKNRLHVKILNEYMYFMYINIVELWLKTNPEVIEHGQVSVRFQKT